MKTLVTIAALIISLTVLTTANVNAAEVSLSEETYIDDIPFSTKGVYDSILAEKNIAEFNLEEEEYIDDIPFDTECISIECLYQKAISVEFKFDEEIIEDSDI